MQRNLWCRVDGVDNQFTARAFSGLHPLLNTAFSLFLLLFVQAAHAQSSKTKTPDEFLPHRLGEQFTPHHLLTDYFEYLAAQCPTTMRLERYGATNEARPLQVAIFSSPENMGRIEQIRLNNLRVAGQLQDSQAPSTADAPAIVWISMSVHGNEPSGSECSMKLAWQLATQTETQVTQWLKNTVVIIDPSVNPDGYDRYTHFSRATTNLVRNPIPFSREHVEPWPSGRPNHYQFDLNRDWAWATQIETQQRLVKYHSWLPHVHPDVHEQGINEPYYFAPAAEPQHVYLTTFQRQFQEELGRNHAQYFDKNGWFYFTKEVFDLLYPSYGDTYPMFNGAIGMTYEQAGNSRAGVAILTDNGDTLTLRDRIEHHLTTSRSTIEMASLHAQRLVDNFRDYYARAVAAPLGKYGAFVLKASNDPNRLGALLSLLDRHQIKYGRIGSNLDKVKAFDYLNGVESLADFSADDIVVSAYQPKSVLLQVLLEPEPVISDSVTYDITAWSLPYAYGLETYAVKQRIDARKPYTAPAPVTLPEGITPYAWCVRRQSLADMQWLTEVLQQGVTARYATEPFTVGNDQFPAGTIVINRADNSDLAAQLDQKVIRAAQRTHARLYPLMSGYASKGADLGSSRFRLVRKPQVAIIYGEEVEENAFGHTWHYFEQDLGMPASMVRFDLLNRSVLNRVNTLVLPSGNYSLNEEQSELLKEWINNGGRLVLSDAAAGSFAGKEGFDLKAKEAEKNDKRNTADEHNAHGNTERESMSDYNPGAIVRAKADVSHPLAYGLGKMYFSLKTHSNVYELPPSANQKAVWLGEKYNTYGFIGSRLKPHLQQTPIFMTQQMGNGSVVYLVDNPLFRSFWYMGKLVFANALFY
jgi:Zinc carboxypeptidase